ncbi:MAG: methionyl-tRNA formyltransferase [Candidatus Cloacimonetes bacterium]|nr:methionyl-tRNA formyltransferase [Candidatus Cloacimonadota bacterium]
MNIVHPDDTTQISDRPTNEIEKLENLIFMGTPDFAVPSLMLLLEKKFNVVLVVSQPDKPRGRNNIIEPTPVKKAIMEHNKKNDKIPVFQPDNINDPQSIEYIQKFAPDMIVTVAYGAYLGRTLRTICAFGAINMHPSLLPLHRGADPIRSTLLAGDEFCGISIFFLNAKMDSGRIIAQESFKITNLTESVNKANLEDKLANLGANSLYEAIKSLQRKKNRYNTLKNTYLPQNESKATYSRKMNKEDYICDFSLSANVFQRKVRAFSYNPGYYCYFRGLRLKILEVSLLPTKRELNNTNYEKNLASVIEIHKNEGFVIKMPQNDLLVTEVQYEGKKRMNAWVFIIGARLQIGETLHSEL